MNDQYIKLLNDEQGDLDIIAICGNVIFHRNEYKRGGTWFENTVSVKSFDSRGKAEARFENKLKMGEMMDMEVVERTDTIPEDILAAIRPVAAEREKQAAAEAAMRKALPQLTMQAHAYGPVNRYVQLQIANSVPWLLEPAISTSTPGKPARLWRFNGAAWDKLAELDSGSLLVVPPKSNQATPNKYDQYEVLVCGNDGAVFGIEFDKTTNTTTSTTIVHTPLPDYGVGYGLLGDYFWHEPSATLFASGGKFTFALLDDRWVAAPMETFLETFPDPQSGAIIGSWQSSAKIFDGRTWADSEWIPQCDSSQRTGQRFFRGPDLLRVTLDHKRPEKLDINVVYHAHDYEQKPQVLATTAISEFEYLFKQAKAYGQPDVLFAYDEPTDTMHMYTVGYIDETGDYLTLSLHQLGAPVEPPKRRPIDCNYSELLATLQLLGLANEEARKQALSDDLRARLPKGSKVYHPAFDKPLRFGREQDLREREAFNHFHHCCQRFLLLGSSNGTSESSGQGLMVDWLDEKLPVWMVSYETNKKQIAASFDEFLAQLTTG